MQNLYISNNFNKDNDFSILNNYLKNHDEIKVNNYFLKFFSSKNKESIFKLNNDFICNLGVFIYKKQYNSEALKLFFNELNSGKELENLLLSNDTRGQFILIIYQNKKLKIVTDRLGYYPMYIFQKGGNISISNNMLALGKNNKCSLNKIGISQYLSENYKYLTHACCDQSLFNEVSYLDAGTIYNLEKNIIKKKYFDLSKNIKIGSFKSLEGVVEKAEELLTENLSFLKNVKGNIHSDITGGIDTRVVIAILSKLGINFNVGLQAITEYKDFSNYGKFSEINVVKKIIDYKKINFELFNDDKYALNSKLIEDITFFQSHKQTYNRRTGYFYNVREKNADIIISGLSGTELFRLSYYDYFKKNEKLNLDTFLPEYVEQVDVLQDNLINKKDYYDHLKNFYESNLKDVDRNKDKDLASYIDYFAFYRTHFCRYLSLANSFLPFYTPYGDFPFASFMYQVSYDLKEKFKIQRYILDKLDKKLASFYCTRGFPLEKVGVKNFYKYANMIGKNIPQQYFSFAQKISNFYGKNLISFLFKNKKIYESFFKNKNKNRENKKNLWNMPDNTNIIEDLDDFIKEDLPVFDFVDKKKFIKYVQKDCNYDVYNRVFNLNRILEYINY